MAERGLRAALAGSLAVHGLILFSGPSAPPMATSGPSPLVAHLLPLPAVTAPAAMPKVRPSERLPVAAERVQRPIPPALPSGAAVASAKPRLADTPDQESFAPTISAHAPGTAPLASTKRLAPSTGVASKAGVLGQQAAVESASQPTSSEAFPGNGADSDAVRAYRLLVASKARGFKRYPADALAAGWAGTAEIRISVAPGGRPQDVNVERSSGYEALDRAALAMIEAGMVRAAVPETLLGRAFVVTLPVVFEPDLR